MKQLIVNLLIFQMCTFSILHAQNTHTMEAERLHLSATEFIPRTMSPEASSFLKVNHIPVSNYTGRAKVEIPIYTITDGRISIPISISYNTSGVKVNDISSCVGLNWSLNAGGAITKIVKGIEDCYYDYNGGNGVSVGWLLKKDVGSKLGITSIPPGVYESNDALKNDNEPDLFIGSAPGLSLRFVHDLDQRPFELQKTGSMITSNFGSTEAITFFDIPTNYSNEIYHGGGTRRLDNVISSISAINSSGLKYDFSTIEVSQSAGIVNFPEIVPETTKRRFTNEKIDSYKLSAIHDRLNNRTVNFEYEKYQLELEDSTRIYINSPSTATVAPNLFHDRIITKYPLKCRINKISFSGGTISFVYALNREDIIGEQALTEIVINNNKGNTIKHFKFTYDYFESGSGNVAKQKRLKLFSVYEINDKGDKLPGYIFHYDKTQLPDRGSLACDFLGYFNSSKDISAISDNWPSLSVYYHMNQGENSLLPFPLAKSNYPLSGMLSLESNYECAKACILNKITYPTDGYQELEYESNSFLINEQEVKGGGLRVKKIRMVESNTNKKRTLEYLYVDESGKTSGTIGSIPRFANARLRINRPDYRIENIDQIKSDVEFYIYNTPRTLVELTHNSYVGYSRVIVRDSVNNGYEEYNYSSFKEFPNERAIVTDRLNYLDSKYNFKKENGLLPTLIAEKDSYRGKLKNKRVFDRNGILLSEEVWDYKAKIYKELDLTYDFSRSSYHPVNSTELALGNKDFTNTIFFKSERYLNNYYKSSTSTTSGIITKEKFTDYHPIYPIPQIITIKNSDAEDCAERFYYPDKANNINSYSLIQKDIISQLTQQEYCDFTSPIKIEKTVNGVVKEVVQNEFGLFDNKIRIATGKLGRQDNNLVVKKSFEKFDTKGNLLEYKNSSGLYVSLIWGYDDQYLLAKIEGAKYSDIPSTILAELKGISSTTTNELNLLNKYKELRSSSSLSKALITTYTYKPLVGISSETNSGGTTTYYEYDDFGRLVRIVNDDKETIELYRYNHSRWY